MDSQQHQSLIANSPAAPSPSVFKNRAFALFWWAQMFSTLALQAESVTIGWQVYTVARHARSIEEGAFLVGMVGLASFAPLFLLALPAGVTADRFDRKAILRLCYAAEIVGGAGIPEVLELGGEPQRLRRFEPADDGVERRQDHAPRARRRIGGAGGVEQLSQRVRRRRPGHPTAE